MCGKRAPCRPEFEDATRARKQARGSFGAAMQTSRNGLLLPPNVVQPLPLIFRHDDYHVIAFIEGHPDYEAVEAMISKTADGAYSIRAILTRHDQSQIDHINDDLILEQMRGTRREMCRRSVVFERGDLRGRQHLHLAFESHLGEPVALEFTTIGPIDRAGAGLTDPGGHSRTGSLPIMFRQASALAGPDARVTFGGSTFNVPVEIRRGSFVAHRAFFTEGFAMAAIRAGTRKLRLVDSPRHFDVGAECLFDSDGRELRYRVSNRGADGKVLIERGDGRETVVASLQEDALEITKIEMRDRSKDRPLTLSFGSRRFTVSLTGAGDLLKGDFGGSGSAERWVVKLRPTEPDWAISRAVTVVCSQSGPVFEASTTIGD